MIKFFKYVCFCGLTLLTSCDLYEEPITSIGKEAIFNSEEGLKTYAYSFYNGLPTGNDLHYLESTLIDYGATTSLNKFINKNAYSETESTGWNWTTLRNLNYFIENCTDPNVSEKVRNHYLGLARFFRAYFYYDMVKRFGDVPWIDRPLNIDDEDLYAERDSREMVMEKVYEDLQFACQNITTESESTCSVVTKWVAYAMASRVALFEGTFRRYHNLNLATSAEKWLERAVENAAFVMQHSGKSLYKGEGDELSYRGLFTKDNPIAQEILMAVCSSNDLAVYHNANWKWTSVTYGTAMNFIRPFINTYLLLDGTPYTDKAGWDTDSFSEECKNRDRRLAQTIRTPGYMREGKLALPDFGNYARLGYQPIKFCVDATTGDNVAKNTNALPLFRYAEVLLNYAEAKAELGTLTNEDWKNTIGALRSRAGITGGLETKPTQIDSYLHDTYFPDINDPVILEIRRERSIELVLEGFRFDDLRRWKCGELLTMSWRGINIPAINKALDMDENGTPDVIYYTSETELEQAKAEIDWDTYSTTCATKLVSTNPESNELQVKQQNGGYYLTWYTQDDDKKVWGEKQYLYPIPSLVMVKNQHIKQNPGWENGASNDGN